MHQNKSLEEIVVDALIERGWHISFAESCTAGLASARLVNVANASKVFDASVVTYANEAKVSYLGVSEETIAQYGVVSEQVAMEMAKGVAKANSAEVGVGISGIAGPGGGTETKPVGMVCFGFLIDDEVFSATCYFGAIGRAQVRAKAVEYAFEFLAKKLEI